LKEQAASFATISDPVLDQENVQGSIYDNYCEEYWECSICKTVNKTSFGGNAYECTQCNNVPRKFGRILDFKKEEIVIGTSTKFL
jgi:hypothetical protein